MVHFQLELSNFLDHFYFIKNTKLENENKELQEKYLSLENENKNLKEENTTLKNNNQKLNSEIEQLKNNISSSKSTKSSSTKKSTSNSYDDSDISNSQTVYITKTGKKYHRSGCSYLKKSKISISLKNAKAQGYTACSRCY